MKRTILERITSVFWPRNQVSDWPEENPANPHRINGSVSGSRALMFSGCWAATNTIAGIFGALPSKVYKKTADGREEASNHSVYRILTREPNPEMDSFVFWEMMTQWWVNYGNAFAEIIRRENSRQIVALHPIHPSRMTREKNGTEYTGRWLVRNNNGSDVPLEADEVFNIVGALSDDGVIGKGVLHYASATIATALAEQGYRADFYANGGRPSGVLEHPAKLSTEARDNLRREWKTVHGRGNEIAILWEGMKFNPSSVSPEHAEIINSSVFSVQEMARFYDLPPHALYELSHGTFANVEEMNRFLVSHPLNRRMVRVEKACDRQLFTDAEKQQGYYVKFNVNALLRGNPKEQAEINQIKLQCGRLSVDEWRAQDDENKLPDGLGNQYWMRRDMAPTELVIDAAKKSIEETTPITPTPDVPDKPPALGNWIAKEQHDEILAEARGLSQSLKNQAAENSQQWTDARERLAAKIASLESALVDREDRIRVLNGAIDGFSTTIDAQKADVAKLTASAEQDAAAYLEACEQRDSLQNRLDTATKSLTEAENAVTSLQSDRKAEHARHAEALATATRRTEEIKAEADTLAREVGTLRAECDGLKAQRDVIDGERIRANQDGIELRAELEKAGKATMLANLAAENAAQEAKTVLEASRTAVVASVRTLLDASLERLLWKEQSRVKDCAKNYDLFKDKLGSFHATFLPELTARLQSAATALEAVGCPRADVAKVAADYVADSRKRLNIAFNSTNRNDIRPVMSAEVEGWENRKQELVSWIGE